MSVNRNCYWIFLVIFHQNLTFFNFVYCFNVDSYNYATYGGPEDSMFGFSLALHKVHRHSWLIVGAPEGQSSFQRGVIRGGAVYKCPVELDGGCEEIPFDRTDDNMDKTGRRLDNKTGQWFGATVSTTGTLDGGPVVACAPRYSWYPRKYKQEPVGTCYVVNSSFQSSNEYAPCRTHRWDYNKQGSCQAGFSAAINPAGDRLYVGAPGSWYWQGQMYSIDAHAEFKFTPQYFVDAYGAEGQVHQQSLESRPAVFSTPERPETFDNSYMGYSTIVGNFFGPDEEPGIAVGVPRGNDLKGNIIIFNWNLTYDIQHLTSDQLGSYYGYCLGTADVDGDSYTDLIVGAPLYTVDIAKGSFDVGRVYVVFQRTEAGRFVKQVFLDGLNNAGRFGQSVAGLGDINQDGYEDFAVGAPYDGPERRGAVYIFHGAANSVRQEASQIIYAEDVIVAPWGALTTFGFALTNGLDLDGNGYPDFGVGAYRANRAFLFRSRPVVRVDAHVEFLTVRKAIDIKKADYTLKQSGIKAAVTSINFCIKYYGKGIPSFIDLGVQYVLDSKMLKTPRMGFIENEATNVLNDTLRLYKDKEDVCVAKEVYIRSDIRDKLTALVAEVKYWMQDEIRAKIYQQPRNPRSELRPVLDLDSPPSRKDSITVHKECGDDNICIPNLKLSVKPNVDKYLLGSTDNLVFDVVVSNVGEDAFESTLEIKYPEGIYYSRKDDDKSHIACNTYGADLLRCDIGNPIVHNKVVRFKIVWQTSIRDGMAPGYDFDLYVNSTNAERDKTLNDNHVEISIAIWANSTLDLSGKSHPNEVFFNTSLYTEDISVMKESTPFELRLWENVIGPQVMHVYNFRNEGPTTINEAELFFIWPSLTLNGEEFVYLLEPPQFLPPDHLVQCSSVPANHLNFHIDRSQKSIWERLGLNTVASVVNKKKVMHTWSENRFKSEHHRKVTIGEVSLRRQNTSYHSKTGTGRFVSVSSPSTSTVRPYFVSTSSTERQFQNERINGSCCGVSSSSTTTPAPRPSPSPPPIRYSSSTQYVTLPYNANHYFGHRSTSPRSIEDRYGVSTLDLRDYRQQSFQSRRHQYKRAAVKEQPMGAFFNPYPEVAARFPCHALRCSYMRCTVANVERDTVITIALRARINARVLRNFTKEPTVFSSIMAARISKLPYIGQPLDQPKLYYNEVNTTVPAVEDELTSSVVPLWVIILSAIAGALILLLLILLLFKCGFFARNRPSGVPCNVAERQPLNRNGY